MPAIIGGGIAIVNIGGNAIVEFGDTIFLSPKNSAKTSTGSGSVNTSVFLVNNNGISSTNTINTDVIDQPIIGT